MNVLVIGDACIDEYRYGTIKRVNPESAAPLLSYTHNEQRFGMAHNVATNLQSLGVAVTLKAQEIGGPITTIPMTLSLRSAYQKYTRADIDTLNKELALEPVILGEANAS